MLWCLAWASYSRTDAYILPAGACRKEAKNGGQPYGHRGPAMPGGPWHGPWRDGRGGGGHGDAPDVSCAEHSAETSGGRLGGESAFGVEGRVETATTIQGSPWRLGPDGGWGAGLAPGRERSLWSRTEPVTHSALLLDTHLLVERGIISGGQRSSEVASCCKPPSQTRKHLSGRRQLANHRKIPKKHLPKQLKHPQ